MSKTDARDAIRTGWNRLVQLRPPACLRPRDEPTVAIWLLLAACGIAISWLRGGGLTGKLVPIEREVPVPQLVHINLNRADWPELTLLPGISQTMARRIVAHREATGPFRTADDLQDVPGIGPKTVARLRPLLDVGEAASRAEWPTTEPASGRETHPPQ